MFQQQHSVLFDIVSSRFCDFVTLVPAVHSSFLFCHSSCQVSRCSNHCHQLGCDACEIEYIQHFP
ncbi:uncharacterized protein LACBIDRAFT_311270 [Laccaria bicolor S238N-H82]|uniref:Predicted protein n=1 Tax=Laccaria bicolor (strain S238N-H82 / ATCC MYA-4686) TaxID=486041 RepID=B0CZL7_LACBS|nr:uncharacterized protein LACBIDRAFT_311270 [Laccaria bicolor S238N-H82]EDR12645.1 predicted protein [Laccaria bicolor S238N-H82]|eukprot:XP_001876909.1 predicted protein [Laccaria bicolor S238N-H82]